jgi:hypothetical protein
MTSLRAKPTQMMRNCGCCLALVSCPSSTPSPLPASSGDGGFFRAFDRLGERFGIRVLGTLDDVWLLMGPSLTYPWTCYILAAAPSYDAVHQVTRQLMEVEVDGDWLWRHAKLEARVGHRLDFGNQ